MEVHNADQETLYDSRLANATDRNYLLNDNVGSDAHAPSQSIHRMAIQQQLHRGRPHTVRIGYDHPRRRIRMGQEAQDVA